jgi:phosphatidylglycerophosphatase A
LKNKLAVFIATWFRTGLIPPVILKGMAGTYGSFFSIPLVWGTLWLSDNVSPWCYLTVTLIIYLVGLWSVPRAEIALGPKTDWHGKTKTRDQNQIVIDETLGMLVTCWLLPSTHQSLWLLLLLGFGLFRLFDIIKIPPTRYFDRMKTANGVMLDDVIAGVYAFICLQLTIIIFHF